MRVSDLALGGGRKLATFLRRNAVKVVQDTLQYGYHRTRGSTEEGPKMEERKRGLCVPARKDPQSTKEAAG